MQDISTQFDKACEKGLPEFIRVSDLKYKLYTEVYTYDRFLVTYVEYDGKNIIGEIKS